MKTLIVLVIYRLPLGQSASYRSLLAEGLPPGMELLVYDNSEQPAGAPPAPFSYRYFAPRQNGGLAAAYNEGLACAARDGHDWLLLLDHDSDLPRGFLSRSWATLQAVHGQEQVAAVVPQVNSRGLPLSPTRVGCGWRLSPLPPSFQGLAPGPTTAINSGAAVRVSFLKEVGGFDRRFRLDYLDHWLFRRIYAAGRAVYLSGETFEHDLSVQDLAHKVGAERYRSILEAESLFFRDYGSRSEYLFYLARLLGRAAKQWLAADTREHARMTFRQLGQSCRREIPGRERP